MDIYRVWLKGGAACYYMRAKSDQDAIERVTLAIADLSGSSAWDSARETPTFEVPEGHILDRLGEDIKTLEA